MLALSLNRSLCPGGAVPVPCAPCMASVGWEWCLGAPLGVTNHGPASGSPPPPDTAQSQTVNGSIFLRIKGFVGFFFM